MPAAAAASRAPLRYSIIEAGMIEMRYKNTNGLSTPSVAETSAVTRIMSPKICI